MEGRGWRGEGGGVRVGWFIASNMALLCKDVNISYFFLRKPGPIFFVTMIIDAKKMT